MLPAFANLHPDSREQNRTAFSHVVGYSEDVNPFMVVTAQL